MNSNIFFTLIALFISGLMVISSCGEPEEPVEPEELTGITDDFDLLGQWNFQNVSGEGTIGGFPQSSVDENPVGYVEFMEGGIGYSDFSLELLGRPFELQDSIVWRWQASDTLIVQAVTEGMVDVWHIIGANALEVNAEWPISVAGNNAIINVNFMKE